MRSRQVGCAAAALLIAVICQFGAALHPAKAASIHEMELEYWRAREQAGWRPWRDPQNLPRTPLVARPREISHEVHGYHPYWQGSAYLDYDWSLISTVAFFSLEIGADGSILANHGWPWAGLVSSAHAGGARVLVTATNFSSSELSTLLANPAYRTAAVGNLVAAVQLGGADGVNVDFENLPASMSSNFVLLIEELRDALAAEIADPYLSVATPAVDWAGSYRYQALSERCDHLMIMAYNYHWSGSATTGPVAPLTGWGTYNVSWTVQDYIYWGAPPGGLLLGVPYYGFHWPAAGPDPGDATTGSAAAITYAAAYPEGQSHGLLWDDEGQTAWYRYFTDPWQQVWFDDAVSLGHKYDYIQSEQLAGIGIWALGYDGSRPELWEALATAFDDSISAPAVSSIELRPPWPRSVSTCGSWDLRAPRCGTSH
jgi:spore germination protein